MDKSIQIKLNQILSWWEKEYKVLESVWMDKAHAINNDRDNLVAFAEMIGEIKLPELKTEEGNQIAKLADASLRDCVDEIMARVKGI